MSTISYIGYRFSKPKCLQLVTILRSNICRSSSFTSIRGGNETRLQFSNGRLLRISSGKFAKLADGCAVVNTGDTNVMVTAVSVNNRSSISSGFVPLTVDYRQKAAAAGRIPTHHLRREIGQSEKEILISRIIDRSLRPLFPKGYNNETQLMCNVLSVDGQNDPDILAINAASAALAISDIPWNGPIGAVRVALDSNNEVITNPTRKELNESQLNLVLSVNEVGNVLMMEAFANEPILEQYLIKTISKAIRECKFIITAIKQLQKEIGKEKRPFEVEENNNEYFEAVHRLAYTRIYDVFSTHTHDKQSRDQALSLIRSDIGEILKEDFPSEANLLNEAYSATVKKIYTEIVLKTGIRCDGRDLNELRPISCEVDLFKPVHGSALFQRGQTQVLCTATLDSLDSTWRADSVTALTQGIKEKNFMLHYEFPKFATNEIGKSGGFGRREIGHGALAERALRPIVPVESQFTTRLLCEVLESNGSSSMASVCAGSLALLDAGVNISAPMAGVAIGLIQKDDEYRILTDISGMEDYFGEMDFKIAGTRKAFTALQLDCKLTNGLPFKILYEAIQKSNNARAQILNIMGEVIENPRQKSKETMPLSEQIEVPLNRRSRFLGVGWNNVKRMMMETGVSVTQDVEDLNMFNIFAPNQSAMTEAKEWINKILTEANIPELEFGSIYQCIVTEIRENGVMVQLHPSMNPTFLHLTQLDIRKVDHPSALGIEEGAQISVKYFGRDPVSGQIRISRKVLQALESQVKNFIN